MIKLLFQVLITCKKSNRACNLRVTLTDGQLDNDPPAYPSEVRCTHFSSGSYDAEYYVYYIYCGAITLSLKAAADALVSISLDAGNGKPGEPGGVLAQLAKGSIFYATPRLFRDDIGAPRFETEVISKT